MEKGRLRLYKLSFPSWLYGRSLPAGTAGFGTGGNSGNFILTQPAETLPALIMVKHVIKYQTEILADLPAIIPAQFFLFKPFFQRDIRVAFHPLKISSELTNP